MEIAYRSRAKIVGHHEDRKTKPGQQAECPV
jgi:hypothetical protein